MIFPASRDVEVAAFFSGKSCHRRAQKGLGCEVDPNPERRDRFTTTSSKMRFVVDKQWRAELFGQFQRVATTDDELTLVANRGGVRQ